MKLTKGIIALLIIGIILSSGCLDKQKGKKDNVITPTKDSDLKNTTSPKMEPVKGGDALSKVKVSVLYERITDGVVNGRSTEDMIQLFKATKTDLIMRGFFRWDPVPESSDSIVSGYPSDYAKTKSETGYTYEQYKQNLDQIKKELPDVLFVGAITAQRVNRIEIDDMTHEIYSQDQTWEMAFNPEKWGLGVSKEETQCKLTKSWNWISSTTSCPGSYDPKTATAYFPDITNEKYQNLLLDEAKRQIDIGADAIWIDMLYKQASLIESKSGNKENAAIKESFDASSKIVDEIHKYGESKGKVVYVGTWWTFVEMPYSSPKVDFVTATPLSEEILNRKLDDNMWNTIQTKVKEKVGNIPIFVFIDFGNDGLPLAVLSQQLTKDQQIDFLTMVDDYFSGKGMIFVYPLHGGYLGASAKIVSFGQFKIYDSTAPEFGTYETIKKLADNKKSQVS